jgi:hypothetical protein
MTASPDSVFPKLPSNKLHVYIFKIHLFREKLIVGYKAIDLKVQTNASEHPLDTDILLWG